MEGLNCPVRYGRSKAASTLEKSGIWKIVSGETNRTLGQGEITALPPNAGRVGSRKGHGPRRPGLVDLRGLWQPQPCCT